MHDLLCRSNENTETKKIIERRLEKFALKQLALSPFVNFETSQPCTVATNVSFD